MNIAYEQVSNRKICLGIYFKTDILIENNEPMGMSHLLEHLVFRRCGELPNYDLYQFLNTRGCVMNATTYHEGICFRIIFYKENTDDICYLLRQILSSHNWTEDEFESEKQIVLCQYNDDEEYVEDKIERKYLEGSYYANKLSGSIENIKSLNLQAVRNYANNIFSIDNAGIVFTGAYDEQVINAIIHVIDNMDKKHSASDGFISKPTKPLRFKKRNKSDIVIESWEDDSRIVINFDIDDKAKDLAFLFLDSIAKGDGSVLGNKLKEKEGITGDIDNYVDEKCGFARYQIAFDVEAGNEKVALDMLFSELMNLKKETSIEQWKSLFDENIKFYTDYSTIVGDTEEHNLWIGIKKHFLGDDIYLTENMRNFFLAATVDEFASVGKDLLSPQNISVAVIHDEEVKKKVTARYIEQCLKMLI